MKRLTLVLSLATALVAPMAGSAHAAGTAPGPVTNVQYLGGALNQVLLTWDAPADPGDKPVSYAVRENGYDKAIDLLAPTTASVHLTNYTARNLTVVAYSSSGSATGVPISVPDRTGDALTVLRPDGKQWISEVDHPDAAMPSPYFPGGAQYQGLWVGNDATGRVRAQQLNNGGLYGDDGGPAGSGFSSYLSGSLVYVRPDAQGNPAIVNQVFGGGPHPFPDVMLRGYSQPASNLDSLFVVPATKAGPTGAPIVQQRNGEARLVALSGTDHSTHPAASPDGRWLAYVQPKTGGGQLLRLRTLGARQAQVLTSTLAVTDVTAISWSLDGASAYVYDDSAKVLTRLPVDPVLGFGTPVVIATGDQAGPAREISDHSFPAYRESFLPGLAYAQQAAGAVITCRLDGVLLPCGGTSFRPHTTPGRHTWSMQEAIDGRLPIVWGFTDFTTRTQRDFTGDGRADFAVFRPSTGQWFVRGLPTVQWGQHGDTPLTADFNGDGKVDYAVYRPSTRTWWVRGQAPVQFGGAGDLPMPADYNGDGKDEIAVFRPGTHQWFVRGQSSVQLGGPGDVPLVGHWVTAPYDGRERMAVCRPGTRTLYVLGLPGTPAGYCNYPGIAKNFAYDIGTGFTDVGSRAGSTFSIPELGNVSFGSSSDIPVVGDYTGDSGPEIVVFRPSNGRWYVRGHSTTQFGGPGDVPL